MAKVTITRRRLLNYPQAHDNGAGAYFNCDEIEENVVWSFVPMPFTTAMMITEMERAAGQAHADAVLADNRLRAQGAALVLVGTRSGLPHHAGDRSRDPGSPPLLRVTGLIPALSCRNCRPHAPFAELVRLSDKASPTRCAKNIQRRILGE